jgi:hypothetical protein
MSHVGLFNYPTKIGQQHRGLKGRDLVREILDGCHAAGIAVQLYNSLIFDRHAESLAVETFTDGIRIAAGKITEDPLGVPLISSWDRVTSAIPDILDDTATVHLARDLAKRIENELSYPGKIKITIIREKRAVQYAL